MRANHTTGRRGPHLSAYPRRIHSEPATCTSKQNSQRQAPKAGIQTNSSASIEARTRARARAESGTRTRKKKTEKGSRASTDEIAAVASWFGLVQTGGAAEGDETCFVQQTKLQPGAHRSIGQSYLASLNGQLVQLTAKEPLGEAAATHTPPPFLPPSLPLISLPGFSCLGFGSYG
ncbi:hypothetical protein V8C42DRAFT_195593 [Trichoderma barbatum]